MENEDIKPDPNELLTRVKLEKSDSLETVFFENEENQILNNIQIKQERIDNDYNVTNTNNYDEMLNTNAYEQEINVNSIKKENIDNTLGPKLNGNSLEQKVLENTVHKETSNDPVRNETTKKVKTRVLSEGEASSDLESVSSVESRYSASGTEISSLEDFNVVVHIENELAYSKANDYEEDWDRLSSGPFDCDDNLETGICSPPRQYQSERKSSERWKKEKKSKRINDRLRKREKRENNSKEREDCDRSRRKRSKSNERKRSRDRSHERRKKEKKFDRRARSKSPVNRNRSLSPVYRNRSRSPLHRKRSKSPIHRIRSRSPKRRNRSKSPVYSTRSRSPLNRLRSKSPPYRNRSQSPVYRARSKSPIRNRSRSPGFRNTRKSRWYSKDNDNFNYNHSPKSNRKYYGSENKYSLDNISVKREHSSSDEGFSRSDYRSLRRKRRRSRSKSLSDSERRFSYKRLHGRDNHCKSDWQSGSTYTRDIKKEQSPFLVDLDDFTEVEIVKNKIKLEGEISQPSPESAQESSPYSPCKDSPISDSVSEPSTMPVPPLPLSSNLPNPPPLPLDPPVPPAPPPVPLEPPVPPAPPPIPLEPPVPPAPSLVPLEPPVPPAPPLVPLEPPVPSPNTSAPPPSDPSKLPTPPPLPSSDAAEPQAINSSFTSFSVVLYPYNTLPHQNHSFPSVSLDNLPLVQGTTGLPVHVSATGECIPYDMDGRRIPVGPNGFYLPVDSSGRLFPHIISAGNTPIPVYMCNDGVLRLPNLEPVPYGPNLPINIDGSLIHIGPDSKPLFPCSNLPKHPSENPILAISNSGQPQCLPPQPVSNLVNIDVSYLIENSPADINKVELLKKYKKKVKEKKKDYIQYKEIEKNLGVSSSKGGVKRSLPVKICTKKSLKEDTRNEVCDMDLESSDSDSGVTEKSSEKPSEEPPVSVPLETLSEDPIVKKIQQAIKSLCDRDFKPPPSGRFILPRTSLNLTEETFLHESPLLRNTLRFFSVTPCPIPIFMKDKSPKDIIFCFKAPKDGSYTKPKSAFEFNRLKKILPATKPQSIFTFDFSMQCDLTSGDIKKLNDEIASLKKEVETLKDCNIQLTDAFKKSQITNEQLSLELNKLEDNIMDKDKEIKFLKLAIAEKERREMDKRYHSNV